ncbi:DUF3197 domain-containing protein [Deinococcus sp. KNUC1210]|uniref:DUF3197 domain-containing protein n=1 Tax=Deinococcus sp. KNUC1210 TaxID=2917691 RepID=UPI001EF0755D|nr:DUF3197 domain-containing protein [Deinococcus sp. KNUC1210]ULH14843.1 DUF3197 domain-containing protein [Deinococcus sp. KNUC1210]
MPPLSEKLTDSLGVAGASDVTLRALLTRLEGSDLKGARLILLTDRQGERWRARYAALVQVGGEHVLTAPAFGPHFGPAGVAALHSLVHWAEAADVPLRETVLSASDFGRVLEEPQAEDLARLVAASSPSDAGIYLTAKNVQAGL